MTKQTEGLMIDARELRIGNYVYGNMDELCIVCELGNVLNPNLVGYREVGNLKSWGQNGQKPIPLTKEWLLKFGFWKKDEITFLLNFDNKVWGYECELEFFFEPNENVSTMIRQYEEGREDLSHIFLNISYVHQLQNLFFALTGKELA